MGEKFCLKWNDFHSNVAKSFSKLRCEDDFYDVTLVGDDQQQISAHKVVLSSCSEYFKNILKQNKHQHPLLCMEGINFNEMENILNYIYYGEVNINQDDLDRFLNTAQRLKLEGLISQDGETGIKRQNDDDYQVDIEEDSCEQEIINVKEVPGNGQLNYLKRKIIIDSAEYGSIEELDAKIMEHVEKDDNGKWKCTICEKTKFKCQRDAREHLEIHFDGLSFPCPDCDAKPKSRKGLRLHIARNHRF